MHHHMYSAAPAALLHVPTVYDLMREQPRSIGTLASTQLEDVFSGSAYAPAAHEAASRDSTTRSLAALLDDIFASYTGIPAWSAFEHLQREGAALRRQLGDGATFAHDAVHPTLTPFLVQWARTLRSQQAARARAVGAADPPPHRSVAASAASGRGAVPLVRLLPSKSIRGASTATATAAATAAAAAAAAAAAPTSGHVAPTVGTTDDLDSSSSMIERELAVENACADLPAEEDGVLPLWKDLETTQRCGSTALRSLRAAVGVYSVALLRLVDISEALADHWGLLSPRELRGLRRAMAAEKAAHVPADFLFSVFAELNASCERLNNSVADLRRCTQLEVVRLNGNTALTELSVLPPRCRLLTACGCSLQSFLAAAPATVYATVSMVGLAYNRLRDVQFVRLLPSLRMLDVSFNYLSDLGDTVREVAAHGSLTEVMLQGNPIALLDVYRAVVVRGCVHLDRLDGVAITGEERALSRPRAGSSEVAPEDASGRPSHDVASLGPARRSTTVALPPVRGRHRSSVAAGSATSSSPPRRKSSVRGRLTLGAARLSNSYPAIVMDASQQPVSDEALRTTVAAELNVLAIKGLGSLLPTPQPCVLESLLPSSVFLWELAGTDGGGGASTAHAGSLMTSPLASPRSSPGQTSGSRKGRGHGAVVGDSGGKGGSTASSASPANKRVAAALYEVTSRVTIEGCWGVSLAPGGEAASLDNADGVRVAVEVALEPPAPTSHHGGRHGGGGGAAAAASGSGAPVRASSAAAGKQRKVGAGAANGNGAAAPPLIADPYVPARAAVEGGTGNPGAVCVVSLPLSDTLVCALQQPVTLRVVVVDTFRYTEGDTAARAQMDTAATNAARGGPASRNGTHARGTSGDFSSHPGLPSASSLAASDVGHERSDDAEEEEEAVVRLRHVLGVVSLDPRDLLSAAASGSTVACTVVPCSATPLPCSRVLFAHDAALEKDTHALKSAEREVRQRQRRLREALAAYSHMLRQYTEATRKGAETPEMTSPATPAALGREVAASGLTTPRSGKRRASVAVTAPPALGSSSPTPPGKSATRSRRPSTVATPALASHLHGLYAGVKAQQLRVILRGLRVLALRSRLAELEGASLSVSARFCIGRGAPPPPSSTADAELDALRRRPGTPGSRKGRQQAAKGNRR